jgi:NAD(P)-dependent dehydrogenase (short-subunit alcohol dehydrogenase family)
MEVVPTWRISDSTERVPWREDHVHPVCCGDLTRPSEMARVAQEVDKLAAGHIVVIAGIGQFGKRRRLEEYSRDDVVNVISSNILPFFNAFREFQPRMKNGGGGTFVTFGSVAARHKYPMMSIYTAAKDALYSLTQTAANEQQMNNIRFVHLNLATLDTERERQLTPLGHHERWLKPEEVAASILHVMQMPGAPSNTLLLDVFHYSDRYYGEPYLKRIGEDCP